MKKNIRQQINKYMIFKDTELLSNLYAGITKQVTPSQDQLVEQAPILSKTELSGDQKMLAEAYEAMTNSGYKKCACKHAAKGCDCNGCEECKCNREKIDEAKKAKKNSKPDYLDVDKDGNKKEPMKKALKDKAMKESSSFKELFNRVMTEAVVCGTKVNSQHQYNCVTKEGEEKVLKGESVVMMKDKLKSVKPAHKK
jgi:hypothetical protein